jgi:hypothetical protein
MFRGCLVLIIESDDEGEMCAVLAKLSLRAPGWEKVWVGELPALKGPHDMRVVGPTLWAEMEALDAGLP